MTPQALGAEVVTKVAEDYRRRGYEVEIEPTPPTLPDFLENYQPDLIARGPSETVVVEVLVGGRSSVADRYREIAELVNREPGWRFSLVYVNPERPDELSEAPLPSIAQLQERVHNAESLVKANQLEAAFLLLWTALEGILRLIGHNANLPLESLPPSTLFRELYSAGEISREHFELIMNLLPLRNRLVHGFEEGMDRADVEQLSGLVEDIIGIICPSS